MYSFIPVSNIDFLVLQNHVHSSFITEMAILLKYVIIIIIKQTVGEAKKKWKDLFAKAWIEDARAQKQHFTEGVL